MTKRQTQRTDDPTGPEIELGDTKLIPLRQIRPAEHNMRRKAPPPEADARLARNIARMGLINPLTVAPNGAKDRYHVTAGGRRYRALMALAESNEHAEWTLDTPVRCTIVAGSDGMEDAISLAENTQREAAHPVDVFETYLAMRKRGCSTDDIAGLMGETKPRVEAILRLERADPSLREIARNGGMDMRLLHAFARGENHSDQRRIWQRLGASADPEAVAQELMGNTMRASDPLVRLVGVDAYTKAKGRFAEDLFSTTEGEEHREERRLLDTDLIRDLADQKLTKRADELRGDWGNVRVATSESELRQWEAQAVDEVDTPPEELTASERNELTAVVYPDEHGELRVRTGLRMARAAQAIEDDIRATARTADVAPTASTPVTTIVPAPSGRLLAELRARRANIVRAAWRQYADGPERMMEALAELLPTKEDGPALWSGGPISGSGREETQDAQRETKPHAEGTEMWERLREAIAMSIDATGVSPEANIERVTETLDIDWAGAWRPTADGYWTHWSRAQLALWSEELTGSKQLALELHRQPSRDIVAGILEGLCAGVPEAAINAGVDGALAERMAHLLSEWPVLGLAPEACQRQWQQRRDATDERTTEGRVPKAGTEETTARA